MASSGTMTVGHLPAGTTLAGKYLLQHVLGAGGMGVVYAARHTFTGRHCAVKVLHESQSTTEGYAERFLREARAAAEINHPSICDVYDAGEEPDGSLYMVLELLEGIDLAAAMKRGDLSTREIIEIGIQTLDALQAAHDRGIIHRDVKPENVFLTRDDEGDLKVKLLDFGVAKNIRRDDLYTTQAGHVVGTPYYMAPEQARGLATDPRADLWSVGAMLFHAFTGGPPFEADNYNRLIIKLLSDEAPSLAEKREDLPQWLVRLVDGALRREPTMRWWCAAQMAAGLRNEGKKPKKTINWEEYSSGTTRSRSPFATDVDSVSPPEMRKADGAPRPQSGSGDAPTPGDPVSELDRMTRRGGALEASGERPAGGRALPPPSRRATPTSRISVGHPTPAPTRKISGFVAGIAVGLIFAVLVSLGLLMLWSSSG